MDAKIASLTGVATDALTFQGLNKLQASAQANPNNPATIKAVAKQFEALFMQRMIETMQQTKLGPDMLGDTAGPMFESLFAQQLAATVTQGRGVGLADFLARQLSQRFGTGVQHAGTATVPAALGTSGFPLPASPGRAANLNPPTQDPVVPAHPAAPTAAVDAALQAMAAPNPVETPPLPQPARSGPEDAADNALAQRARGFFASIMPSVRAAAARLQVTPVAILAQAALETGWGNHAPGHNLFGIKAGGDWGGARVSRLTHEVRDGVSTISRAAFRAYDSAAESVQNFADLLASSPRYQGVQGKGADIAGYAEALQRGGYATDPHYASKLLAIAHGDTMREVLAGLDVAAAPTSSGNGSAAGIAATASSFSLR